MIKKFFIRKFGLKGSWSWAKRQLRNGKMVRCKHWSGCLKYKLDSKENGLLMSDFSRTLGNCKWTASNHHLSYENFTDYTVFNWIDFNKK